MKAQTFNDGVLKVYKVDNIAKKGNLPKDGLVPYLSVPYEERTVGVTRFNAGKQNQNIIEQLLRIPRVNISRDDIVIPIDGEQYRIEQIQVINDVAPKCLDLSLERVKVKYEID